MNWPLAITRNRTALLAIVASIVALIAGREGGTISRRLRNAALALLRPAESAARRLIVIAARGVVAEARPARALPGALGARAEGEIKRTPAFRLFDPKKRYSLKPARPAPRGIPRIRSFWDAQPALPVLRPFDGLRTQDEVSRRSDPNAPVDASRLILRLAALERALADLPRQAKRLARWRAKGRLGPDAQPKRPLRLGRPPGWRVGADRAVDHVLSECHRLALDVLAEPVPGPDTS
jgi:hypothetical protein